MPIDFLAGETQFLDHAAPVWKALRDGGRFLVASQLADRAAAAGVEAEAIDITQIRRGEPQPPAARPGPGPIAFATSIGDMKVGRRLGYRRFIFMEHGAGQAYLGAGGMAHPSYAGGADREDVELFLVPNTYSAELWKRRYPAARVEIVGCPRLDTLPRREPSSHEPGPTIAISFHWPAFVAPEAGTALGHYFNSLAMLARRFRTIGHAHPKADWPARMQRYYERAGIEFVGDFNEVCRRADVYACDNSSTLFEFAATGRPVVVLNAPTFRRDVSHGLRFWDAADVGVQVDGPAGLIPGIELALEDRAEQQANRERALGIVYAFRSGAAERAAAAITDHVSVQAVA